MAPDHNIFFRDTFVGVMRGVTNDMWYMDGKWEPASGAMVGAFEAALWQADLRETIGNAKGKLVMWQVIGGEVLHPGLALQIAEGRIVVRKLIHPAVVEQLQQNPDCL